MLSLRKFLIIALVATGISTSYAQPLANRPDVREFINTVSAEHRFDAGQLSAWFNAIQSRDDIIAKITRPAEKTKAWYEYRAIFLDQARIDNGVKFWRQHQAILDQAQLSYGVPAEIIVAILCVETRYGKITGRDGVLEALATLAFDYPRRADFFRSELEHYLLLTREERIDPLTLRGSYAGAMGLAQFMPSSYRAYAVDFDGDGRRDLWQNPADAIGSIGNYLHRHRWQPGEPIVLPAKVDQPNQPGIKALLDQGLKPQLSVAELRAKGVTLLNKGSVNDQQLAILLALQGQNGMNYWLGFNNFYVITRYNRSPLYAMAVYELGQEVRRRFMR